VLDILALLERRLDAARIREVAAINNLVNCCITDNNNLHAQAAAAATAIAPPSVGATTSPSPTSTSKNKITKRKLPEPRVGWKDFAGNIPRAHSDAMAYHKTMPTMLRQLIHVIHKQSNEGSETPAPLVPLARFIPLATLENNIDSFIVLQLF